MNLHFFESDFCVCKLRDLSRLNLAADMFFLAKTADELSLVCRKEDVPDNATHVDQDWKAFRIEGQLDFSLVGILAEISRILAEKGVSIFAASTYDTDYVLVKRDKADTAKEALREAGYGVV